MTDQTPQAINWTNISDRFPAPTAASVVKRYGDGRVQVDHDFTGYMDVSWEHVEAWAYLEEGEPTEFTLLPSERPLPPGQHPASVETKTAQECIAQLKWLRFLPSLDDLMAQAPEERPYLEPAQHAWIVELVDSYDATDGLWLVKAQTTLAELNTPRVHPHKGYPEDCWKRYRAWKIARFGSFDY